MTRLSDIVQSSVFQVDSPQSVPRTREARFRGESQRGFVFNLEILTAAYQCAAREDK
jgi:hypothetical protein